MSYLEVMASSGSMRAAAAFAVVSAAFDVQQRLIGHVEQASEVIALYRAFFSRGYLRSVARRIHEARNTLELLIVGYCGVMRVVEVGSRILLPSLLITHSSS